MDQPKIRKGRHSKSTRTAASPGPAAVDQSDVVQVVSVAASKDGVQAVGGRPAKSSGEERNGGNSNGKESDGGESKGKKGKGKETIEKEISVKESVGKANTGKGSGAATFRPVVVDKSDAMRVDSIAAPEDGSQAVEGRSAKGGGKESNGKDSVGTESKGEGSKAQEIKGKQSKVKSSKVKSSKVKSSKVKSSKVKSSKVKSTKVKSTKVRSTKVRSTKGKGSKRKGGEGKGSKKKGAKGKGSKGKESEGKESEGKERRWIGTKSMSREGKKARDLRRTVREDTQKAVVTKLAAAAEVKVRQALQSMHPVELEYLVDASLPSCPPLLASDGRHVLTAGPQSTVKLLSLASGEHVSTLYHPSSTFSSRADAATEHTRVTSILQHPRSEGEVIVITSDGIVAVFDYLDGNVVARYDLKMTVTSAIIAGAVCWESQSFPLVVAAPALAYEQSSSKKHKDAGRAHEVYAVKIPTNPQLSNEAVRLNERRLLFKMDRFRALAVSTSGLWIGAVGGQHAVIARFPDPSSPDASSKIQTVRILAPEPPTCIAFPPDADVDGSPRPVSYFATGGESGRIALWHALAPQTWLDMFQRQTDMGEDGMVTCPTSILHWHAHAVADLDFTPNGAYLVSGGTEAVIVLWQLASAEANGSREYLPRLGGPLKYLRMQTTPESGPVLLVTRTDDNVLAVDPTVLRLQKTFAGRKPISLPESAQAQRQWGKRQEPLRQSPLVVCRNGSLIAPSSVLSAVQILHSDGKTDEIEVAPSNRVSTRDDKTLPETLVQLVAVGGKGDSLMATVDHWHDDARLWEPETHLKFWKKGADGQFRVTARVNDPHASDITSLSFDPKGASRVITSSTDGTLKVWSLKAAKKASSRQSSTSEAPWRCEAVLSYRQKPIRQCSWCSDGSLIAAVHDDCVSLWDTLHLRIVALLAEPSLGSLWMAVWDAATDERLWVSGKSGLGVFDVSSGFLLDTAPLDPTVLLPIPGSSDMLLVEPFHGTYPPAYTISTISSHSLDQPRRITIYPGIVAAVHASPRPDVDAEGASDADWDDEDEDAAPQGWPLKDIVFLTLAGSLIKFNERGTTSVARRGLTSSGPHETMFSNLFANPPARGAPPGSASASGLASKPAKAGPLSVAPHVVPPASTIWEQLMTSYTLPCKS